ncbi:MAG TPA: ion channel [Polyangiaceae bacterium]|nr:ion channel [Polyangiaceae bacterium]
MQANEGAPRNAPRAATANEAVPALAVALETAWSAAGPSAEGGLTYPALKRALKDAVANDPFDATVVTVLGGAFLFYLAEKDTNPKVKSYWDALVFISTCLSVGYADVFARTPAGKAIATAVMTVGPALSGAIFDGPGAPVSAAPEALSERTGTELLQVQRVIVEKLDAIVTLLQKNEGRTP